MKSSSTVKLVITSHGKVDKKYKTIMTIDNKVVGSFYQTKMTYTITTAIDAVIEDIL